MGCVMVNFIVNLEFNINSYGTRGLFYGCALDYEEDIPGKEKANRMDMGFCSE